MGVCKYLDLSTSHLSAMGRLFLANPEKFEKQGEVVVCPKSYSIPDDMAKRTFAAWHIDDRLQHVVLEA